MYVFGPVPSRRLGRSLGINNIPAKKCSYSCVYCQLGAGYGLETERRAFYEPREIVRDVTKAVDTAVKSGETIDYLTFVPDGEPTLDVNLGRTIKQLRPLGVKTAVITNSSIMDRDDVKNDLSHADLVSIKVDTVNEKIWRRINRPYRDLRLDHILTGIGGFASSFEGEIITETMLIGGFNDGEKEIQDVAGFLKPLAPSVSFVGIPTRPPAEKWVKKPDETSLTRAFHIMSGQLKDVEYLIGYEGDAFAHSGNVKKDILSITSVHPMRLSAVKELLDKSGSSWVDVKELLSSGKLREVCYQGDKYYLRNLKK